MRMNKRQDRHMPGDQGQPYCPACRQKLRFGTDHNGGTIQWCRCGEFELATIRLSPHREAARKTYQRDYHREERAASRAPRLSGIGRTV